jgi:hypothetical protein
MSFAGACRVRSWAVTTTITIFRAFGSVGSSCFAGRVFEDIEARESAALRKQENDRAWRSGVCLSPAQMVLDRELQLDPSLLSGMLLGRPLC